MSRFNDILNIYGDRIAATLRQDSSSAEAFSLFTATDDKSQNAIFHAARSALGQSDPKTGQPTQAAREALFTAFARLTDPTGDHASPWKYLDWICRAYLQDGAVRTEDLYKIADTLRDFAAFAPLLGNEKAPGQKTSPRSIEHYPTLEALRGALRPLAQKRDMKKAEASRRRMADEEMKQILEQTSVVYDGPEGKIVVPYTQKSCVFWGQQTQWCVSAEKSKNFFGQYNDKAPLWIYLPKVSAQERALFRNYSSFKFAGTQGKLYNENDRAPDFLPPSLHRLIKAALGHVPSHMARHLNRHGGYMRFGFLPRYKIFPLPADPKRWRAKTLLEVIKKCHYSSDISLSGILALTPERLRRDDRFILAAAKHDRLIVRNIISPALSADRNFVSRAIDMKIPVLDQTPAAFRKDRDIVTRACAQTDAEALHIDEGLRADRDFMLSLVKANGDIYKHLSKDEQADRDFVLAVLRSEKSSSAGYFRDLPTALQNDTEIIEAFVAHNDYIYENLPREQRNIKSIALAAIGYSNRAASEMSRELMADEDIVMTGLRNKGSRGSWLFPYIAPALLKNRETVMKFVHIAGEILSVLGPDMKADHQIVMTAIRNNPEALRYADDTLKDDAAIVRLAVRAKGSTLQYASPRLRNDRDIVRTALRSDPAASTHTSLELRLDRTLAFQGFLLRAWDSAIRNPMRDRAVPALKQSFNGAAAAVGTLVKTRNTPKPG